MRRFQILGGVFVLLGFITIVGIVAQVHFGGGFPFLYSLYAAMNLLLAYGFFTQEKWVLYAVSANTLLYTLLYIIAGILSPSSFNLLQILVSSAMGGTIWVLLYLWRRYLVETTRGRITATLFGLCWLSAFGYTALNLLNL